MMKMTTPEVEGDAGDEEVRRLEEGDGVEEKKKKAKRSDSHISNEISRSMARLSASMPFIGSVSVRVRVSTPGESSKGDPEEVWRQPMHSHRRHQYA